MRNRLVLLALALIPWSEMLRLLFKALSKILGKGITDLALQLLDERQIEIDAGITTGLQALLKNTGIMTTVSKQSPGLPTLLALAVNVSAYAEWTKRRSPKKVKAWDRFVKDSWKNSGKLKTVEDYNRRMREIGLM